jgi:hypothetical protein
MLASDDITNEDRKIVLCQLKVQVIFAKFFKHQKRSLILVIDEKLNLRVYHLDKSIG